MAWLACGCIYTFGSHSVGNRTLEILEFDEKCWIYFQTIKTIFSKFLNNRIYTVVDLKYSEISQDRPHA